MLTCSELVEVEGKRVEIDDNGYLANPSQWWPGWAEYTAQQEGVTNLTDKHWRVINFLRDYYLEHGIAPMIRKLCKETDTSLKEIYELFPTGPAQGACKCAGLPKPTGCV